MTEDVLAIFPASEIWGLNRRWPCLILLSDQRLIVLKGERSDGQRSRPRPPRIRLEGERLDEVLTGNHYSLPLERIRRVEVRPSLTSDLLRILTQGGSYRFRLRKRQARRLERHLRELLGDRVRRPGE
jgi:hypothetical protein